MEKRKVLVPVDGSEFCRQIFPVLSTFLDPTTNELILLRVGEPVEGITGAPPRPASMDAMVMSYDSVSDIERAAHPIYASQQRHSAAAELEAEMRRDAQPLEAAGFSLQFDLRFGSPGEEIVSYVTTQTVDLIAMTTHWRTGINRLLFGNTVQYLVPRVRVPLLMLRPEDSSEEEAVNRKQ